MTIDQLIAAARQHSLNDPEHANLTIPQEWTQGRTAFGGLSAALVYEAIKARVADDRVMRSFNCNFVGPLEADVPFEIQVEVLREGKNASQILAKAIQNDKVAVLCQVCFGVGRSSKIKVDNQHQHGMKLPEKAKFIPQIPKITPKFLRHFDLAMDEGGLPFTGSKVSRIHGWMRYTKPPESITDAHIIGLIDAWPPTVLQMLKWPAPASTMCWNVEFIHPHQTFSPTNWFAFQANTRQAAQGYAHTEANIWDQQGTLIALSRQTVGIFD